MTRERAESDKGSPKPRKYNSRVLTDDLAGILNQRAGRLLRNRTPLQILYRWNYDHTPNIWVRTMTELTPPQKGAVAGALWAALDSDITLIEQLRVPSDQFLHTKWTFGKTRIEFLRKVFARNKPEIPNLQ